MYDVGQDGSMHQTPFPLAQKWLSVKHKRTPNGKDNKVLQEVFLIYLTIQSLISPSLCYHTSSIGLQNRICRSTKDFRLQSAGSSGILPVQDTPLFGRSGVLLGAAI